MLLCGERMNCTCQQNKNIGIAIPDQINGPSSPVGVPDSSQQQMLQRKEQAVVGYSASKESALTPSCDKLAYVRRLRFYVLYKMLVFNIYCHLGCSCYPCACLIFFWNLLSTVLAVLEITFFPRSLASCVVVAVSPLYLKDLLAWRNIYGLLAVLFVSFVHWIQWGSMWVLGRAVRLHNAEFRP